ncbi:MAG: ABC transporter substrate binding protein [Anaeromusa sp.]|uniref:ABC transporter substrate binding protein n=1 Tax=Anaeromusa sp. TaxID=1872520 RepID=UPI002B1F240D|nr:ABC transporter substrate binding protein [Anaeromusa sp.]MEA4834064.1 ABC transporter substrate binding protein [Anaeromusa sp.]
MRKLWQIVSCLLLILTAFVIWQEAVVVRAENLEQKRVLVLNSYGQSYKWTRSIVDGASSVFLGQGERIELTIEDMDSKYVKEQAYFPLLKEVYAYKWRQKPFDLILASDDTALQFLLQYRQQLFPQTPVIFCGVNDYVPELLQGQEDWYTGVAEVSDLKSTLETALQVQPQVRHVYVINDQTNTGKAIEKEREVLQRQFPQLQFHPLEGKTMAELEETVSVLGEDSIVLLLVFFEDAQGQVFSYQEAAARLAARSSVPIYGAWDFYLGHGILGGKLVSGFDQGRVAAQMAVRVLGGESPAKIPVVRESMNRFQFDDVQLRRFGIAKEQLPPGSLIVNRSYSDQKQVLVLYSYDPDMIWEQHVEEGLRKELAGDESIKLVHDYMDVRRNIMPEYLQHLYELYRTKYSQKHFDAIVAVDDAAYQFVQNYRQELFPGVPLIFAGVNDVSSVRALRPGDPVTGVVENIDLRGTLETITAVQPETKRIVVIQDTSAVSMLHRQQLEEEWPAFAGRLEKVYLDDLNMWELQERVAALKPEDVVLLLTFTQDRSNNVFAIEESCRLLAQKSSVPIYTPWDFYLGYGALGGKISRGSEHGELTAQQLKRVLSGEDPRDIPVLWEAPSRHVFDYQMMKKFGLAKERLPKDSVLLNQPESFYEQHRQLVWGTSAVLTCLLAVILSLYINIRMRKKVQKRLAVQADTDQLTGVFNRRRGLAELKQIYARSLECSKAMTIIFADANNLKKINDQYGHTDGDAAIIAIAEVLKNCLRQNDVLCRLGGDEFLIILEECTLQQAEAFWERVEKALWKKNRGRLENMILSVSRGMAELNPQEPVPVEMLIHLADQRMYENKREHKRVIERMQ